MKKMPFFITVLTVLLLTTNIASSQTKSRIEGVWRLTEWIEHGDTNTNPQPGLIIFTRGYYSIALVMAPTVDSLSSERGRKLTDAEKIERFEQWKWFVGVSGSYEIKDSTIVMHPIVAKDAGDKKGQGPEYKLEGSNTLWLIPTRAKSVGLRMKLTKLE